jgi:hypothetical protein
MGSLISTVRRAVYGILGIQKIIDMWGTHPWLVILVIICTALTVAWMIKLFPRLAAGAGKTIGGIAMGFIVLAAGIAIYLWVAGMILGIGTGAATGVVGRVLGGGAKSLLKEVIASVVGVLFMIGIVIFIFKSFGSIVEKGFGAIRETAGKWEDTDGGGFVPVPGMRAVKWLYVICGVLIPAFMLNHPNFMVATYYIPSGISATLGIVALILKTKRGRAKYENVLARKLGKAREPDGAWRCPNFKLVAEIRDGFPTGRFIEKYCEGPQGKDAEGKSYDGWNPKHARFCMSPYCDHPNPYWQVCTTEGCEFAKNKTPFPRRPDKPVVCPGGCNTTYPVLPKSTPFHSAEEDQYHVGMAGVPGAAAAQTAEGNLGDTRVGAADAFKVPESGTYADSAEMASYDMWLKPHA